MVPKSAEPSLILSTKHLISKVNSVRMITWLEVVIMEENRVQAVS